MLCPVTYFLAERIAGPCSEFAREIENGTNLWNGGMREGLGTAWEGHE